MDLDRVLLLLSLREDDNSHDDDLMDIDSEPGTHEPFSIDGDRDTENMVKISSRDRNKQRNKTEEVSMSNVDEDSVSDEVQERLLVLSLLSPTSLGAQYAMNQRKDSHDDHDLSFDLAQESALRENHKTTFSSRKVSDLYQKPSYTVEEPEPESSTPGLHQETTNVYRGTFPVPFPMHVHHHHYYGVDRAKTTSYYAVPSLNEYGHLELRAKPQAMDVDQHVLRAEPQLHLSRAPPHRIRELPLPWDSESSPAERNAYVLSSYLQLAVNTIVSAYALHIVWSIVAAIRKDVSHKLSQHANNLLVEIASCERSYKENKCHPDEIVPALEKWCAYWEQCMKQDPERGGNVSSLGAQTIGMVITSLIEPLSFKTLSVFASAVLLVYVYNFGFGYIRARTYYGA